MSLSLRWLSSHCISIQFLKKVLELSGIQNKAYKSHSFRICGATLLFSEGKSVDEIKSLGRWTSNAYKSYIR